MEICRSEAGRVEATTLPCGDEEDAELFLWSLAFDGLESGWYVREDRCWEVASVLHGSCARRVALDPLPTMASEGTISLVSLDRFEFMADLLARGEARPRPSYRRCV